MSSKTRRARAHQLDQLREEHAEHCTCPRHTPCRIRFLLQEVDWYERRLSQLRGAIRKLASYSRDRGASQARVVGDLRRGLEHHKRREEMYQTRIDQLEQLLRAEGIVNPWPLAPVVPDPATGEPFVPREDTGAMERTMAWAARDRAREWAGLPSLTEPMVTTFVMVEGEGDRV